MLGLLFLLIVLKRDIVHNRALVRNELNALVSPADTDGCKLVTIEGHVSDLIQDGKDVF